MLLAERHRRRYATVISRKMTAAPQQPHVRPGNPVRLFSGQVNARGGAAGGAGRRSARVCV